MKSFLIKLSLLFMLLIPQMGQSQNSGTVSYINWTLSSQGCYGCSSFYWGVTRSSYADTYGYYNYYVWMYSNSYVWDYYYGKAVWRPTYVWGLQIRSDNYVVNQYKINSTFKESTNITGLNFRSKNPRAYIVISWDGHKLL